MYPAHMVNYKGSEYGGVPGKIAPLPHELSPYETFRLAYQISPDDITVGPQSIDDARVAEARAEGRGGIQNPDGFDGGGA